MRTGRESKLNLAGSAVDSTTSTSGAERRISTMVARLESESSTTITRIGRLGERGKTGGIRGPQAGESGLR